MRFYAAARLDKSDIAVLSSLVHEGPESTMSLVVLATSRHLDSAMVLLPLGLRSIEYLGSDRAAHNRYARPSTSIDSQPPTWAGVGKPQNM